MLISPSGSTASRRALFPAKASASILVRPAGSVRVSARAQDVAISSASGKINSFFNIGKLNPEISIWGNV